MNKKFSTLLAGLVLATSAASAATTIDTNIKLKVGPNDGLYQITSASDPTLMISLDDDGKLGASTVASVGTASFASTLWCIHIDDYNKGQNPRFDFTNKQHGRMLEISMDGAMSAVTPGNPSGQLTVGGDINGWAFSSMYKDGVEIEKPLFSYYKADSVVALKVDNGTIVGVKMGANQVQTLTDADKAYKFTLKRPERITLDAKALNTMLGMYPKATSFKLNFDKVANPNVFANELTAVSDTLSGFVTLINKETGKYLRVDTAYNNTTGVKFLQLTDTTSYNSYVEAVNTAALVNGLQTQNYAFHFEYSPASDSIFITVAGAVLEQESGQTWATSTLTTDRNKLHVYVQDLVTSSVLTVGTDSTKITLGFGTCTPVVSTDTTVASDLYVIKSADGKYLAAPIHGDSTVQWVTLEKNVNIWEMPSFQWVVEKNIEKSDVSMIKITNREFGTKVTQFTNIQLDKVVATALTDDKGVSKGVNVGGFLAATAAIKADSLLGYKYLDPEELLVTRYKFRYLHDFSDEKYAGVNSEENDSILYVGGKSPFSLKVKDGLYNYGYTSTAVAGLKPLYRQSYTLKIRNAKLIFGATADSVVLDAEGRFAVSEKVAPLTFLLKANNEKEIDETDVPFYAFIKLGADTTKVGTDDNNLWMKNQIMTESRTSAFSVEVDDSPLYRRFWTEKEGEANDNPDTVKFFRVNNPADMLFEDSASVYSKNKNINFLGVSNNIQFANEKRAIYVDTAYVNRGTGYIKPQYMLAVGVNVVPGTPGIPCNATNHEHRDINGKVTDKEHCIHATPATEGYVRGRYLINTVDSAKVKGNYQAGVRDADYIWNNQVRLAFVEAIHKEDTLYILNGAEATLADPVDFSKLKATKIRLDNNLHKNVVFSFRLLEEGNDDFLIESAETDGNMIAPMKGGWVKIQNGVPVISYDAFSDAANESEIFNVVKTAEKPVANESIDASAISVSVKEGAVIVKGAAGKTVAITNVLGQTIASKTITSDEVTIAAPKGYVTVAVEGEAAVKAIVK